MKMYRQGDVLIQEVKEIPKEAVKITDPVLAHGEVTGHKHQVVGAVQVMQSPRQKYLEVEEDGGRLVHEEHGAVELPAGKYAVIRQREYNPQANRYVMD